MKRILLGCVVLVVSCSGGTDWNPAELGEGHTSQSLRQMQLGREIYATYCVGCHGEKGDGVGPAARFLSPKPRDLRLGRIKFAAVASGEAPRDEDYNRIISHGLSGTAMPSFALLGDRERLAVISYIKTFNPEWKTAEPGGALAIGKDPWSDDPQGGIAEGKKIYHGLAKCWTCHPAYETPSEILRINAESKLPAPELRPNLYVSELKESDWGAPILPPDFLFDRIKNGSEEPVLVQVIAAGVGGTAMPMWSGALDAKQLWGLAHYVHSLALLRATPEGKALQSHLLSQPIPQGAPQ